VLITGASSGIGVAAVPLFAAEGARLALLARGPDALDEAARGAGVDALLLAADVTDRAAVQAAVDEAAARLGGLDVLVENAAAGVFGHFLEVPPDDFDRAVDVTFRGSVNVVRAALPHLRQSRGTIVATGSLVSRVPMPAWTSYSAAKHALRGFLNALRIEEREQRTGVRVAIVHPGVIDTPFWSRAASATGRKPRVPPDTYGAGVVARALVEAAVRPRREVVLGGVTVFADRSFVVARPLVERLLVVLDRWLRSGEDTAADPGTLWRPTEQPNASAGLPARDSTAALAQPGAGTDASAETRPRLLPRAIAVARKAVRLRGRLAKPVPERPPR
jgi:NAD(P)-dependent dehydrogenase (short-subunit alcohol dehydrogenase family)